MSVSGRSQVSAGSELLDLYAVDTDRSMLEGIDRLFQTQDEAVARQSLDLFSQFLKDHKRFPESTSIKAFDALIEGLLNVANTNPAPDAGRGISLLLAFLSSGTFYR